MRSFSQKSYIYNMKNKRHLLLAALCFILFSCTTVKPYELMYLNDAEMELGNSGVEHFEHYVHSIREGAVPGGDSKSGGGCGCN